MRAHTLVAAFFLLGALSACGGDETRERNASAIYEPGVGGRGLAIRPGIDPNALYGEGMDLKAKGDCTGAVVRLRRVASIGPGYENAQTALGDCLTQNPANVEPSSDYLEGIVWLRRAADAGWPEAQGRLAQVYALGPSVVRAGQEAAYWLALYDANPGKSRVGFMQLDPTSLAAVRASLSAADQSEGAKRATQWQRKVWIPSTPTNAGLEARPEQRRGLLGSQRSN